jgi:hypothetical protein
MMSPEQTKKRRLIVHCKVNKAFRYHSYCINCFDDYIHNYSSLYSVLLMLSYLETIRAVPKNSNLLMFCKCP